MKEEENTALISLLQRNLEVANKELAKAHKRILELTKSKKMEYKFNEDEYLMEAQNYIQSTYTEHYAKNKYQATDVIIDSGHGVGFCMGNIFKYAKRYGLKNGYARSDLLKILHYVIIALYVHDKEIGNVE